MEEIINVETISDLHNILDYEKPDHPLITLIDVSNINGLDKYRNRRLRQGFYSIALKNGAQCDYLYGRERYDFREGSLIFLGPGQISTIGSAIDDDSAEGWVLCFHPDLIRGSSLAAKIESYTYFSYSLSEALHLSNKEKDTITSLVEILRSEFTMNLDIYSQKLLISNLETLLNYCERFYGRQFITRKSVNSEVVVQFEELIKNRFQTLELEEKGIPNVKELASDIGYSPNYLSDFLKKETGRSTQEHIHDQIIERAKNQLLGSDEPVSSIAYHLGYEYPEHFSSFFKKKVGVSPANFRKSS